MLNDRVRTILIVAVSLVWVANYTASIINPNYKPDPAINAPFLAVIGALVASGRGGGKSDPKPPKEDESE
ncbi:hypothetical protein AB0P21_09815 [Kribbella sp. NPDC056861]|uniref:hypothetical protein n=1 Tax=Kribbella sp. NPDC056861 TaxID=3154857 RepID=UPI00342D75B5